MIRTILIDDEQLGLNRLDSLIRHLFPVTMEIVGKCLTVEQALNEIEAKRPDLIFLDVKLGNQEGFDLLVELPLIDFDIIFCTAHKQYALEAFQVDAVDYLLKPVDPDQLIKAVNKVLARSPRERADHLQQLTEATSNEARKISLIRVADGSFRVGLVNGTYRNYIKVMDIYYCVVSDGKSIFYGCDRKKLDSEDKSKDKNECVASELTVSSHSLNDVEKALKPLSFFRIHESYVINMAHMKAFRPVGRAGIVTLTGNKELEVSIGRKVYFLKYMNDSIF